MKETIKLNMIMTTQNLDADYTKRFLSSLDNQDENVKKRLRLIAVIQHPTDKNTLVDGMENIVISIEKSPLSVARNVGISAIPEGEGIVCFPDDDCWYNDTVLPFVFENFENSDCDYFCAGIYDPIHNLTHGRYRQLNMKEEITAENILQLPISVTIFYKFNSPLDIPKFDERFGVGTEWGSGEETDFLLELERKDKKGVYNSYEQVYHETGRNKDFNFNSIKKYSVGFAVMMQKSLILREQKEVYKQFKKMITRNRLALLAFFPIGKRRRLYRARLKGFKQGVKIGKSVFGVNR